MIFTAWIDADYSRESSFRCKKKSALKKGSIIEQLSICDQIKVKVTNIFKKDNEHTHSWAISSLNETSDEDDPDGLRELWNESEFEVGDGQEADGHDDQRHMVLPEAPRGEVHTLAGQKGLPGAAASVRTTRAYVTQKPRREAILFEVPSNMNPKNTTGFNKDAM